MKKTFVIQMTVLMALSYNVNASNSHKMPMKKEVRIKKMPSMKMNEKKKDTSASTRKALTEEEKSQIIKVLKANEALHAAFFKYEASKVEAAATSLNTNIEGLSNKEISKLLKYSQSLLMKIKASSEREENNKNYHLVSMALIHIVNTYDIGDEYNSYSCPMVKKKWVQNTKESDQVNNPYAPNMPHCGRKDSKH
jgi:hypothetical protein